MLSAVYKAFEATEVQLTPKAITRLRVSAILSLFAIPIFAVAKLFDLPNGVSNVIIPFGLLCMLAMAYAFSTRLANRLWVPEKYLDESEIERKRRSSSLTYHEAQKVAADGRYKWFMAATLIVFGGLGFAVAYLN